MKEGKNENYISLRTYFESEISAQKEATALALTAQKEAAITAKESMERRLDEMNNFRASLKDAQSTFVTKENFEAKHDDVSKQLEDLKLSRAVSEGKASLNSVYLSYIMATLGIIISLVSIFYHR